MVRPKRLLPRRDTIAYDGRGYLDYGMIRAVASVFFSILFNRTVAAVERRVPAGAGMRCR